MTGGSHLLGLTPSRLTQNKAPAYYSVASMGFILRRRAAREEQRKHCLSCTGSPHMMDDSTMLGAKLAAHEASQLFLNAAFPGSPF